MTGDFATVEKQFTDDVKAALPPGALAPMWAKLLNQAGAYKSCSADPRVRRIDDKEMVITPCEFERTTIDIQFAFDSAGRISGLVFRPSVRTAAAYTLPSYAKPSSFVERELTLGSSEWALPATLTIPAIALSTLRCRLGVEETDVENRQGRELEKAMEPIGTHGRSVRPLPPA